MTTRRPYLQRSHRRCGSWLLGVLVLIGSLFLTSCGGSGSGTSTPASSGTVIVGLTDADGDFVTYTVDVTSLTLTRRDGAVVDVLPTSARVDFAQYTDLTELLAAASVPTGFYTEVDMTLDYRNADIRAAQGNGVVQLTAVDAAGTAITTLEVVVRLDTDRPLPIARGVPAHLSLDFDLEATNSVDLNAGTVTVFPLLVADVNPDVPKPHRVRGPLIGVAETGSSFEVSVRPFHLQIGDFGRLTVETDANTVFEIDGHSYQGAAGLAALAAKPALTATVAIGEVQPSSRTFLATEVQAGSSVAFGASDVVIGSVTARSGDALTVRGATLVRQDGTIAFNDTVSVLLDSGTTKVVRELDPSNSFDTADVSVGQQITALGTLSGSSGSFTLDAAASVVRMEVSSVSGLVVQRDSAPMTVEVQSINGRPVALYDFTGTAADPQLYRVDTGSLALAALGAGDPVRVRGFAQPFDSGVTHDFDAISVTDLSDATAWLAVVWIPSTGSAFDSLSDSGMVVNPNGSIVHRVVQRGVFTDLASLSGNPTVAPESDGRGIFAVGRNGIVQIYTTFATFNAGLTDQLGAHSVQGVLARGSWDAASERFTGSFAAVSLH